MKKFLPVVGYEGLYQVSNCGDVKSLIKHNGTNCRIMRPSIQKRSGHLYVMLTKNKIPKKMYVHRLVLDAFIGEKQTGQECLHGDGDPKNNNVNNLRWGSHSENMQDMLRHGTANRAIGARHGKSILTDEIVLEIKNMLKLKISGRQIAKRFSCLPATVSQIKLNKIWKHV